MLKTSERMFKVVIQLKGKPVAYPEANGEASLKLMKRLSANDCFSPVAYTTANGIEEVLTMQEMREIYSMEKTK
jgi:hypothetical protein